MFWGDVLRQQANFELAMKQGELAEATSLRAKEAYEEGCLVSDDSACCTSLGGKPSTVLV